MQLSCPQCDTTFSIADEALGTDGRKVRCSACSHVWHASPPAKEDVLTLEPAPAPEPAARQPAAVRHPTTVQPAPTATADGAARQPRADSAPAEGHSDLPPLAHHNIPRWDRQHAATPASAPTPAPAARARPQGGWGGVILGLLLLAAIALSYLLRDQIAAAVPAAKQVYQLAEVPLQQIGHGLEFVNLASGPVVENGQPLLRVTGFIQNTMDFRRELPWVSIQVLDSQDAVIASAVRPPPPPGMISPQGAMRIVYDLPRTGQPADGTSVAVEFVEGPSK